MAGKKIGRRFKFPNSKERSEEEPAVFCPKRRVMGLYNQSHTRHPMTNLSDKVRKWFEGQAGRKGWGYIEWFNDAQKTKDWVGCVVSVSDWGLKRLKTAKVRNTKTGWAIKFGASRSK